MTAAPANRAAEPADAICRMPAPSPAISGALGRSYADFLVSVMGNKPVTLRAENSPAALEGRVCDVNAQIIACATWLKALVEDTAQHLPLAARLDDVVEAAMGDMASDVRGRLIRALEDRRS